MKDSKNAASTSKTEKNKKETNVVNSSGRSSSASNKRKPNEKGATASGAVAAKKKRQESDTDGESISDLSSKPAELTGFDKGLEAEKILGASDSSGGGLAFLIQFKGVDQAEMVQAAIANVKIPQMVIKFYEERLSWYSDNEE